ncbi:PAS domain-containing protein [Octadecabacter sp. 1_MG-2023]|uniref:PAS domain-containing protein n=1 Tax=unclassified Octadecabacter TaxID=196158 RepID=UPI001C0A4DA4|nr:MULTISPECIES: PAS domain-containing protein [unclassified Octadecabacter]MBU2993297.1 PAS domain-containing protein [Octadecabacter sp. B2R22]MDO6733247.1 PAS domain-containing protein [Octadecabacter sp. 1_MG-2023]
MSAFFDKNSHQSAFADHEKGVLMTNPTELNELETYWASLPRHNGVPLRKDVDPSEMGGLLENSFILERVAPGVARFRVAGRNIGRLIGIEPRGLPITTAFVPQSRGALGLHLEAVFTSPGLMELNLEAPRAVGQPLLKGKILMLPLRDEHGGVSRALGVLVMSGIRGIGGRRFAICDDAEPRFVPAHGLRAVVSNSTIDKPPHRPSLLPSKGVTTDRKKAGDSPALRLVVSNP